jgi:hypothetical protein
MYRSHIFLMSTLVGGERSASRPDRFIPGQRASGTYYLGSLVGSRAGLDYVALYIYSIIPYYNLYVERENKNT